MAGELGSVGNFMATILPSLKLISIVVIVGVIFIGAGYYFLILSKRKKWFINVYEQKADGRLHLVDKDVLQEKKMDYGRRVIYWLKKGGQEATPPPWESIETVGRKDFADYIRIRRSLIPIKKQIDGGINLTSDKAKLFFTRWIDAAIDVMHKKYDYNAEKLKHRFIFVPINKVPHINVGYMQMDYDVDMMRINAIDNIDLMFAERKNFWEKYGNMIAIGVVALLIIVVAYLSFEYMSKVIANTLDTTGSVTTALEKVAAAFGSQPKPVA